MDKCLIKLLSHGDLRADFDDPAGRNLEEVRRIARRLRQHDEKKKAIIARALLILLIQRHIHSSLSFVAQELGKSVVEIETTLKLAKQLIPGDPDFKGRIKDVYAHLGIISRRKSPQQV